MAAVTRKKIAAAVALHRPFAHAHTLTKLLILLTTHTVVKAVPRCAHGWPGGPTTAAAARRLFIGHIGYAPAAAA